MLHTEAFIHYLRSNDVSTGLPHLAAARRLLDVTLDRSPGTTEFVIRWYAFVEQVTLASGERLVAQELRQAQRDRWEAHPARRLYRSGWENEIRGNQRGAISRFDARGNPVDPTNSQSRWFDPAALSLKRALNLDRTLAPAALRLGRILMVQGNLEEASAALRRAIDSPDAYTAYLARLFLGSIEERQGRLEPTAALYERAMAVYPYGQSACLALSHLWNRRANAEEARAVLVRCLGPDRDKVVEPLWTYVAEPAEVLVARFDELRVESWQ